MEVDSYASVGNIKYACEVKPYPYLIGSSGYGSVGQALAMRHFVDYCYVVCVASEIEQSEINWRYVTEKSSTQALFQELSIKIPDSYDKYKESTSLLFKALFYDLGLGLLLVHEFSDSECTVDELIVPELMSHKTVR